MSQIRDIEIALRDGMIAELSETIQDNLNIMRKSLLHIKLSEEMIDQWRDTAYQYREIALELTKAYEEQSCEIERLKANGL
jgi:hypothetical protein